MTGPIIQLRTRAKWHANGPLSMKLPPFCGKHTFFSFIPPFLTSAVISRFISNPRWLFHTSKHHPKYNNQKESEKINQCPQTTDQFWQVQFIPKSYSSLGILLSCLHNALEFRCQLGECQAAAEMGGHALFHPGCFVPLMPPVSLFLISEVYFILEIL